MPDRKKVIKGLEICEKKDCVLCPYKDEKDETYSGFCEQVLKQDALALLKEQEAIKPYIDIDEAKCPICKVKLTRQELLGDDVLFEDFFDYCPHCGRTVKWE